MIKKNMVQAILFLVIIAGALPGCGGLRPTVFINEQYDFRFLEHVAVIPFDNLSNDQGAGNRATRLFISKILAERAFDVVEPGEVSRVLEKYSTVRTGQLTEEQIKGIGQELKVQGIILGTVTESSTVTSGGTTTSTITIIARMVETENGTTIWSATNTAGGRGFWGTLFGTGGKSQSEATRNCVDGLIKTLVK